VLEEAYLNATRHAYRKAIDGPVLFKTLDPELAAKRCPHLKTILADRRSLALAVGGIPRPWIVHSVMGCTDVRAERHTTGESAGSFLDGHADPQDNGPEAPMRTRTRQ
jgi:hypothetical protein